MRKCPALFLSLALALASGPAFAQGLGVQFLNFEAPAHKPIAVVDVAGNDFLLVANGPDNSVEVYDTAASPSFLCRVPTGQRPVTLAVRPSRLEDDGRQVYVANWLGDSITVFNLLPVDADPRLRCEVVRTQPVGDEPVGIAFLPENPNDPNTLPGGILHELVFVTFSSRASWGVFQPGTLTNVVSPLELLANGTVGNPNGTFAVKDPRAIAFAPPPGGPGPYNDQLWILNFRGGNDPQQYDLDFWGTDNVIGAVGSQTANLPVHDGFGTTNFQFAFADNGDAFAVGILARNKDAQLVPNEIDATGEPVHQAQVLTETGFAVSYLARHKDLTNAAGQRDFLDLNDTTQGASTPPQQAGLAVTQPTDLAIYGDGEPGTRVFVTGFNSDTLGRVTVTNGAPTAWTVARVDVNPGAGAFDQQNRAGVMRGPRGLALQVTGTPSRDRLYVYNRLESSVSIVDPNFTNPAAALLGTFLLQGQVEPVHVINGRKFLYSSKLSNQGDPEGLNGNVSCSTCHIDGKSDFLAWNLASGSPIPAPGSPNALPGALGPNSAFKGPMVTQPLQGLVNFEVANDGIQDLFYTNKPYHWRGDKGFVEQFNAAFHNLMGAPQIAASPPTADFNQGITTTEMTLYRDFIFSIHYPPNRLEPWPRVYSGTLFDEDNPPANPTQEALQINDPTVGGGGQLGLKGFHIVNSDGRSCVHCHALPEGSNNLLTEAFFHSNSTFLPSNALETAQLKSLVVKEKRLIRSQGGTFQFIPSAANNAVTHEFGLVHTGKTTLAVAAGGPPTPFGSLSINDFVKGFGALAATNPILEDAVSLYMREFDSGVAPLVGFTASLNVAEYSANPAGFQASLAGFEGQRLVPNAALAVHARINGVLRGFWYDVTNPAAPYREEPQTGLPTIGPFSSTALLNFLDSALGANPTNLMTFHFTPLGSSRRVARIQGGLAPPIAAGAPTNLVLQPCPTMSANVEVPRMTGEWTSLVNTFAFFAPPATTIANSASVAHYQVSLVNNAPGGFGLSQLRHEAPRRFRVTGDGIDDGAFLILYAPNAADIASAPAPGQAPTTVPNAGANPFNFVLPLYAGRNADEVIWETAAEMEPLFLLSLVNGGPVSPSVVTAFFNPFHPSFFNATGYVMTTTDLMQPTVNNWYFLQVVNFTAGGGIAIGTGGWQRLTIQ